MPKVRLISPDRTHTSEFLRAVKRSQKLHRPWNYPPATVEKFHEYLDTLGTGQKLGYFVLNEQSEIAAGINVGGIIYGPFQNGFLGYSAFVPHNRKGYVRAGLVKVITLAFRKHRLHRLEANIQSGNVASIRLAQSLGFVHEGFSRKYLKIGGRWTDHERFAITADLWNPAKV